MFQQTLHNRWLRVLVAGVGTLISAVSLNIFIVPQGLYSGGLIGVCQLIRNLLQAHMNVRFFGADLAGILYFVFNVPLLLFTGRALGKSFVGRTLLCATLYSVFCSLIPIPATPIVADRLTACLLGGILAGVGSGIVLTCGGSGGGLDVVGLCLSKRGSRFTVGKFSLTFNFFLYAACLVLFSPEVAIYSVIYNFFTAMVLDRMHQQNVSVQALIFTRNDETALARFIIDQLGRSVTYWNGIGAYTGENVHVLCVCLSKYEIDELLHAVNTIDPHAFVTAQEGTRIYGNFSRKLG